MAKTIISGRRLAALCSRTTQDPHRYGEEISKPIILLKAAAAGSAREPPRRSVTTNNNNVRYTVFKTLDLRKGIIKERRWTFHRIAELKNSALSHTRVTLDKNGEWVGYADIEIKLKEELVPFDEVTKIESRQEAKAKSPLAAQLFFDYPDLHSITIYRNVIILVKLNPNATDWVDFYDGVDWTIHEFLSKGNNVSVFTPRHVADLREIIRRRQIVEGIEDFMGGRAVSHLRDTDTTLSLVSYVGDMATLKLSGEPVGNSEVQMRVACNLQRALKLHVPEITIVKIEFDFDDDNDDQKTGRSDKVDVKP